MAQELLYTSAPRGLKPGSRGFCTVLSTQGMPAPLASAVEALSGYRSIYPPSDERAARNPVVYSHLKMQATGKSWHVLSRIADYGLDYSQRPNKLAHHVILDSPAEQLPGGPANLLATSGFTRESWEGDPTLVARKPITREQRPHTGICEYWKAVTGDAGWAGVVAESFLRDPDRQVILLFEPGQEILPLFAEAISLLPLEKRWDVTFSTYFTGLATGTTCNWRAIVAGSKDATDSLRNVNALRIDLYGPQRLVEQPSEPVVFARTGQRSSTSKESSNPSRSVSELGSTTTDCESDVAQSLPVHSTTSKHRPPPRIGNTSIPAAPVPLRGAKVRTDPHDNESALRADFPFGLSRSTLLIGCVIAGVGMTVVAWTVMRSRTPQAMDTAPLAKVPIEESMDMETESDPRFPDSLHEQVASSKSEPTSVPNVGIEVPPAVATSQGPTHTGESPLTVANSDSPQKGDIPTTSEPTTPVTPTPSIVRYVKLSPHSPTTRFYSMDWPADKKPPTTTELQSALKGWKTKGNDFVFLHGFSPYQTVLLTPKWLKWKLRRIESAGTPALSSIDTLSNENADHIAHLSVVMDNSLTCSYLIDLNARNAESKLLKWCGIDMLSSDGKNTLISRTLFNNPNDASVISNNLKQLFKIRTSYPSDFWRSDLINVNILRFKLGMYECHSTALRWSPAAVGKLAEGTLILDDFDTHFEREAGLEHLKSKTLRLIVSAQPNAESLDISMRLTGLFESDGLLHEIEKRFESDLLRAIPTESTIFRDHKVDFKKLRQTLFAVEDASQLLKEIGDSIKSYLDVSLKPRIANLAHDVDESEILRSLDRQLTELPGVLMNLRNGYDKFRLAKSALDDSRILAVQITYDLTRFSNKDFQKLDEAPIVDFRDEGKNATRSEESRIR